MKIQSGMRSQGKAASERDRNKPVNKRRLILRAEKSG